MNFGSAPNSALTCTFIATLVLALFWPPWHSFLWQAEGSSLRTTGFRMEQYSAHIPAAFLIVWFFNHNRGSIPVADIAEASANTTSFFFKNQDRSAFRLVMKIVALMTLISIRVWKHQPIEYPARLPGDSYI